MADEPFYSSQSSEYEQHKIIDDQENMASSPLQHAQKPKKPPTVTPKRFTKFFTPRASLTGRAGRRSKAGRQLRDITRNAANRSRGSHAPTAGRKWMLDDEDPHVTSERPAKRRKQSFDIASSSPLSSPLKQVQVTSELLVFEDSPTSPAYSDGNDLLDLFDDFQPFPKPVRRLPQSGRTMDILGRSFGGYDALSRGRRGAQHCIDWQSETANFASTPNDRHSFSGSAIPFCTTACNTNSLVAVGEEDGSVRLFDSSLASDFSELHIKFRPHHNAIMDMAFSSDDYTLATASGDQTARLIDMHTQQTVCVMSGHTSSVKQVRFLPSDSNIITTSSRDGSVQIWDMRCGAKGSVSSLRTSFARYIDNNNEVDPIVQYSKHTIPMASIHRSMTGSRCLTSQPTESCPDGYITSITSIQHLPNGREHLLLTACEVNSSLKIWDLRHASRRGFAIPISSTRVPQSHVRTRHHGINSMSWSSDGSRLFTACKDGGIYAYSTNHLVLGNALETDSATSRSRMFRPTKDSIEPSYVLRHPAVRLGSFYVKASVRPANGDKGEMLAVGSSDNCAVLFATDERYLPKRDRSSAEDDADADGDLPSICNINDHKPETPSYSRGTALIRGHRSEVTGVAWTHDGDLVTLGDDWYARCWREDGAKAMELRTCGEGGGQRWGCGWAEVKDAWDEEDG